MYVLLQIALFLLIGFLLGRAYSSDSVRRLTLLRRLSSIDYTSLFFEVVQFIFPPDLRFVLLRIVVSLLGIDATLSDIIRQYAANANHREDVSSPQSAPRDPRTIPTRRSTAPPETENRHVPGMRRRPVTRLPSDPYLLFPPVHAQANHHPVIPIHPRQVEGSSPNWPSPLPPAEPIHGNQFPVVAAQRPPTSPTEGASQSPEHQLPHYTPGFAMQHYQPPGGHPPVTPNYPRVVQPHPPQWPPWPLPQNDDVAMNQSPNPPAVQGPPPTSPADETPESTSHQMQCDSPEPDVQPNQPLDVTQPQTFLQISQAVDAQSSQQATFRWNGITISYKRRLAKGAMSYNFTGLTGSGKTIVIKLVHKDRAYLPAPKAPEGFPELPTGRQLLIQERDILARATEANQRHLAHLYAAFDTSEAVLFIQPLYPDTLQSWRSRVITFSPEQLRHIAAELILGLEACWEFAGVMHRDIKPANIFVSHDGHLKLGDFGVAYRIVGRSENPDPSKVTTIGGYGTPCYMAPEMVQGTPYNRSVDMWAVGMILLELHLEMGGEYFGPADVETMRRRFDWVSAPDTSMVKDPQARKLIRQMVAREPAERPSLKQIKRHRYFKNGDVPIDWDDGHLFCHQADADMQSGTS
ncbi:kinase-like protein [Panus rudis PR-1116 ss-1]|nr:kinase-like protein [Panus rudis PR-1116 ss-1]